MARSRVCACRGCEHHTGACGWPTTNERRCDRCGRPGFANRFRADSRPPDPADVGLATAGEADGRGPCRPPWLALSGLAPRAARRATRRARGRPSGAARPRWRATAGKARRPLRELQRAQGIESAAAVRRGADAGRELLFRFVALWHCRADLTIGGLGPPGPRPRCGSHGLGRASARRKAVTSSSTVRGSTSRVPRLPTSPEQSESTKSPRMNIPRWLPRTWHSGLSFVPRRNPPRRTSTCASEPMPFPFLQRSQDATRKDGRYCGRGRTDMRSTGGDVVANSSDRIGVLGTYGGTHESRMPIRADPGLDGWSHRGRTYRGRGPEHGGSHCSIQGPCQVRIPRQSDHRFHGNPISRSTGFRSPHGEAVAALT